MRINWVTEHEEADEIEIPQEMPPEESRRGDARESRPPLPLSRAGTSHQSLRI